MLKSLKQFYFFKEINNQPKEMNFETGIKKNNFFESFPKLFLINLKKVVIKIFH